MVTQVWNEQWNYATRFIIIFSFCCCDAQPASTLDDELPGEFVASADVYQMDSSIKTIHVFVALCDNRYQGIVPVPSKIGNGQDPNNNLYWGCAFGIKTYFKNSSEWKLIRMQKIDSTKMERLVFRHRALNYYLVADAYNGKHIKACTVDFLNSSCGKLNDTLMIEQRVVGINAYSQMLAYIGHDGLMDFELNDSYLNTDHRKRDVVILACYSKHYFSMPLKDALVNPLVWSSGLMAPEAYTLHDALSGYVLGETNEQIRSRAALAYARYQKCSERAARNLLLTGW